jgi:hypothetical protein
VASNPGQIPAGGKDKISVVVGTKNRGGSHLRKRFTVMTNDPQHARTDLAVFGQVKGFLSVTPTFIRLTGRSGELIRASVKLVPEDGYPFTIKEVKAKDGDNIRFDLKPLGKDPARQGYELMVWNTRTEAGNYRDFVMIETDLKEKPSISIPVNGRVLGDSARGGKPKK